VIMDSRLCSARDETSFGSGCRVVARGSSNHFPIFCFLKRGRGKGLGIGPQFDPLAASGWWGAAHVLWWGPVRRDW
jgi:hypothetical protein